MKKILLMTLSLLMAGFVMAGDKKVEEYCRLIDDAIAHSADYVAAHEQRISEARRALGLETTQMGRYQRNFRLYELYKPFVSDSAMFFLHQCIAQAGRKTFRSANCSKGTRTLAQDMG